VIRGTSNVISIISTVAPKGEGARILCVDDEVHVLKGLERSLRGKNGEWQIDFVMGGEEALQLMNGHSYDLIVSDMMMPGMPGEELLGIVAELYPNTVRIILSGHYNQSTAFRLVGSDHLYLSKPCPRDLFINTIEQALYLKQSEEKPIEPISHGELVDVVTILIKQLLVQQTITLAVLPINLRAKFLRHGLQEFAPILNADGYTKGSVGAYVSNYLDDVDYGEMSDEDSWFTEKE